MSNFAYLRLTDQKKDKAEVIVWKRLSIFNAKVATPDDLR